MCRSAAGDATVAPKGRGHGCLAALKASEMVENSRNQGASTCLLLEERSRGPGRQRDLGLARACWGETVCSCTHFSAGGCFAHSRKVKRGLMRDTSAFLFKLLAPAWLSCRQCCSQASFGRFFKILFYENSRLRLPKCRKS